jgi:hypothetical protein
VSRRLNKSVLVGGVVYPAGAEGADVEKAVSNPEHWDDFDASASSADGSIDEGKLLELVTLAKTHAGQVEALLGAIAPLIDAEADVADLHDIVFGSADGIEQLSEHVRQVTTEAPSASPVDYSAQSKPDLEAEVKRRNEGREKPLEVKAPGNKPDLIAALQADDKNS